MSSVGLVGPVSGTSRLALLISADLVAECCSAKLSRLASHATEHPIPADVSRDSCLMAGLVASIHAVTACMQKKAWMAGTRPAMTGVAGHDGSLNIRVGQFEQSRSFCCQV